MPASCNMSCSMSCDMRAPGEDVTAKYPPALPPGAVASPERGAAWLRRR